MAEGKEKTPNIDEKEEEEEFEPLIMSIKAGRRKKIAPKDYESDEFSLEIGINVPINNISELEKAADLIQASVDRSILRRIAENNPTGITDLQSLVQQNSTSQREFDQNKPARVMRSPMERPSTGSNNAKETFDIPNDKPLEKNKFGTISKSEPYTAELVKATSKSVTFKNDGGQFASFGRSLVGWRLLNSLNNTYEVYVPIWLIERGCWKDTIQETETRS